MQSIENSKKFSLDRLVELVARLRGEGGCPWDRKQDLKDIKIYLIEECYEVVEAIEEESYPRLKEELGDLLFHIVFLAYIADERQYFGLDDVIENIYEKMIRRHPHVFGDLKIEDIGEVKKNWWELKRQEKDKSGSLLDDIPRSLPALHRAFRLGRRASRVGFDWPEPESILEKINEEINELNKAIKRRDLNLIEEETGDLLFSISNLARSMGINPEDALQKSNEKFIRRFTSMERHVKEKGGSLEEMSLEEMDELWNNIKEKEK